MNLLLEMISMKRVITQKSTKRTYTIYASSSSRSNIDSMILDTFKDWTDENRDEVADAINLYFKTKGSSVRVSGNDIFLTEIEGRNGQYGRTSHGIKFIDMIEATVKPDSLQDVLDYIVSRSGEDALYEEVYPLLETYPVGNPYINIFSLVRLGLDRNETDEYKIKDIVYRGLDESLENYMNGDVLELSNSGYAGDKRSSQLLNYINLSFEYLRNRDRRKQNSGWKKLISNLESDIADGINPIYTGTYEGNQIDELSRKIESKLGISSEVNLQGENGSIEFYDSTDNLISSLQYRDWCDELINLALKSKSKQKFESKLTEYYRSMILD